MEPYAGKESAGAKEVQVFLVRQGARRVFISHANTHTHTFGVGLAWREWAGTGGQTFTRTDEQQAEIRIIDEGPFTNDIGNFSVF